MHFQVLMWSRCHCPASVSIMTFFYFFIIHIYWLSQYYYIHIIAFWVLLTLFLIMSYLVQAVLPHKWWFDAVSFLIYISDAIHYAIPAYHYSLHSIRRYWLSFRRRYTFTCHEASLSRHQVSLLMRFSAPSCYITVLYQEASWYKKTEVYSIDWLSFSWHGIRHHIST